MQRRDPRRTASPRKCVGMSYIKPPPSQKTRRWGTLDIKTADGEKDARLKGGRYECKYVTLGAQPHPESAPGLPT
jgi:hypothetical protein